MRPYISKHIGLLLVAGGQCLYEPPRPEHTAAVRGLMPPPDSLYMAVVKGHFRPYVQSVV